MIKECQSKLCNKIDLNFTKSITIKTNSNVTAVACTVALTEPNVFPPGT